MTNLKIAEHAHHYRINYAAQLSILVFHKPAVDLGVAPRLLVLETNVLL